MKEFPNEINRLQTFIDYLKRNNNEQVCDWNNFDGHNYKKFSPKIDKILSTLSN